MKGETMLNFLKDESGQTILEYALIVAVLVLVIIAAIPNLRQSVMGVFQGVEDQFDEAGIDPVVP
jgi:pilus assembly protein Flp/PilA